MNLRVVVADDERPARQRIRTLLRSEPDIEVVAECEDGASTVAAVAEHRQMLSRV